MEMHIPAMLAWSAESTQGKPGLHMCVWKSAIGGLRSSQFEELEKCQPAVGLAAAAKKMLLFRKKLKKV